MTEKRKDMVIKSQQTKKPLNDKTVVWNEEEKTKVVIFLKKIARMRVTKYLESNES